MEKLQCFPEAAGTLSSAQWAPWQPTFHQLGIQAQIPADTSSDLPFFIESRQRQSLESEHQGQEDNFLRSLTGRQTSEVQGVGTSTRQSDPGPRSAPCPLPEVGSPYQEAKVRNLWARSPTALLCFGQAAPLWTSVSSLIKAVCSVALCTERHCVVCLQGGRNGHTWDTWDARARCQARNLSRNRGWRPQPGSFLSLQGQAQLPPKAP